MEHHDLKTWPIYYNRVVSGDKMFELRKNDRDFQTGDMVTLKEYDLLSNSYTGRFKTFEISYILHGGQFGIEPGYCVFGLHIA